MTYETRPGGRQAEAKRSTTKARTRRELVLAQAEEDDAEVTERDGKVKIKRKAKRAKP